MRRFFVLVAALAASASMLSLTSAQSKRSMAGRDPRIKAAVRAVLDAQVAAWNRGDIDDFMSGYWQSPETVFISGDDLTRGWDTVLARYKKSYDSREKMGTLSFSEINIEPFSRDRAIATGRWQLVRGGDAPRGRFTLIFRRTREGWRIMHDHTSSAT